MAPSKLSPPRPKEVYPRERLFSLLDRLREHPVIWISGPAGAGKTLLANSYLRARKLQATWYNVDTGDKDPGSFFHHFNQTVPPHRNVRNCLAKVQAHFASVNLSMAMRIMFSAVAVRISTSFASLRNAPSQAKVRSTTQRLGKTAKPSLIFSEICRVNPSTSSTKRTAMPRYPASPENASRLGGFFCGSPQDFAGTDRIVEIGRIHLNMEQMLQHIDDGMAFTTFHFFTSADAAFFAVLLGLDALRVDEPKAGPGGSAVFFAVSGSAGPALSPSPPLSSSD